MCSHTAAIYSEGLSPPQVTSTLQVSSFQLNTGKAQPTSGLPMCPCSPKPGRPLPKPGSMPEQEKKGHICLGRGWRNKCTGTCRRCEEMSPTNLGHISLPALRMWCLFTKPEQLLVRPCILPLKCCACGTPTFLGAAFPSSLASALQRLSPSSSGDSSPLLSKSSSPADAFCPFKELSPVPAGLAGLASAVLAFQPGWQLPGSSCPSDAVSVGKDKRSSCSMQEEATLTHPHTCRKNTWLRWRVQTVL